MLKISSLVRFLKALLAIGALGMGAVAALNALISAKTPLLGPRLRGHFGRFPARYGDLSYIVAGAGSPILLVHGIDPGRSMAEFRAIFDDLAKNHTVYAFDFVGFGLSDANSDGYNAADFAEQIEVFIRDVIGEKTTVVAAGQGAVFAVLAAAGGAQISKLALVCPQIPAFDAPSPDSRGEALLLKALSSRVLRAPILGEGVLNLWRSRERLRGAANEAFFDKSRAQNEAKLWYATAHQRGAQFAQSAFLSNEFQADWRQSWEKTDVPALLIWGRGADEFEGASEWLTLRPDAQMEVVEEAMRFPHLEKSAEVGAILERFFGRQ